MNTKDKSHQAKNPGEIWDDLIKAELKSNSKLGKSFSQAGFGGYENKILTLYFSDEGSMKTAKGFSDKLKEKLQQQSLVCDRINFLVGEIPKVSASIPVKSTMPSKISNPLQALSFTEFEQDNRGNELVQPVLAAVVKAEASCDPIYVKLRKRTEELVGNNGVTLLVSFNWRLRVGGTRGFRELLLPVFHPVFGIPYIPSSSLKGSVRAWARKNGDASQVLQLLGMLEGKTAIAAKVEFLDAFPTKHCLDVDVATPQWHWQDNKVTYKPEPHPLLSMKQPQFCIGICPTARGSVDDVRDVKEWLENALKTGIGSRVSSGYGRALGQIAYLPHSKKYDFVLWTQAMYGSEPPTRQNGWNGIPEFRPSAVRGILRYWFRAVALGLYDPGTCQTIEDEVFGNLSKPGNVSISVLFNAESPRVNPYFYSGKICLEASEKKYLNLICELLILASHLGGVGRGSRRPLHLLNGRMRGCNWEVNESGLPFEYNPEKWQQFLQQLKKTFTGVRSPTGSYNSSPGKPNARQQDVLDKNAQIWLLNSPAQIPPDQVKNWLTEGDSSGVRGSALNLLYSDNKFKGVNQQNQGNSLVGGALETPSFVWIKSIFPSGKEPYQVVTIFGVDFLDRKNFAQALKNAGAVLVNNRR